MNLFNLNSRRVSAEGTREELLRSIRKELRERRSAPKNSDEFFVTAHAVGEILTIDRIRAIFTGLPWHVETYLETIWKYLSFKSIFLSRFERPGSERPVRGDHLLPFSDLNFLSEDFREEFEEHQHIFRPILIVENSHHSYPSKSRLPFLESEKVGDGGFGEVMRVLIERNQIEYTSGVYNGDSNHEPKNMARKVIDIDRSRSFQTENFNLEQFKKSLSTNKNIMMSFATFEHGSQFNIISPLANLDLHTFLHAEYGDFHQRSTGFTPQFLFEETWCLAFALKFLHAGLALPTGRVSCAHLDLKPENILVEWSTQAVSTVPGSTSDTPVGRWKISDFGISVVKPLDIVEGHSGLALTPGDVIRERSVNPPRDPGPFQAPEMQRNRGLRVSTSSDMWSFGCIVTMILAFALGGPEKVSELYKCRKNEYPDDYFYTDTSTNGAVVKPEIEKWLGDQVKADMYSEHMEWILKCQELVHDLLAIDKSQRPSDAGNRLLTIGVIINSLPRGQRGPLWMPEQLQLGPGSVETFAQEMDSTLNPELNQGVLVLTVPPVLGPWSPQGEQVPLQLLNTPEPSTFARLEVPTNVTQTALSPCGRRVAFLSGSTVYVYTLDQLHQQNDRWTSQRAARRIERNSFQQLFQCFHCFRTCQWTSVLLAGHFIALVSTSRHRNDYTTIVDLHDRPELGDLHVDYVDPMHKVSVPENCLEVKLSPKGILLLQFHHRLELSSSRGRWSMDLKRRLVAASFSHDGEWLYAWQSDRTKYYWFVWDMSQEKMKDHGTYSRNLLDGQSGVLPETLIPATHSPHFVVCDQYGRTSIIRGGSPTPREAWDIQLHQIVAALMPSSDDAVVFIRQPHSVASGQTIEVALSQGTGLVAGARSFGELDEAIDAKRCGIAIYVNASPSYLLTCYPDGLVARKMLMDRASRFSSPSQTPT